MKNLLKNLIVSQIPFAVVVNNAFLGNNDYFLIFLKKDARKSFIGKKGIEKLKKAKGTEVFFGAKEDKLLIFKDLSPTEIKYFQDNKDSFIQKVVSNDGATYEYRKRDSFVKAFKEEMEYVKFLKVS